MFLRVPYFSPQFLFKFVKRISLWPWWLCRKNELNAEVSVWVWNLETKALGPWVTFSFEASSTISSILLWWLKCQHSSNHKITSAESTEKEENRSCYEGLILCVVLSLVPLVDAQQNVSTCSISWSLGKSWRKEKPQGILCRTHWCIYARIIFPQITSLQVTFRLRKESLLSLFFPTSLYSELGNSLLCKLHKTLSPETLSTCVLYPYLELYLLGGRKPQEPTKVRTIVFLPSVTSDIAKS